MEDLLKELIAESPSLVGVIAVVILFLRHNGKRDKERDIEVAKRNEVIERIAQDSNEVIRENTQMFGRVLATLNQESST